MGKIIGIDLGTTNSAVAIYENDQAKIYENQLGKRTTPSVVALKKTRDKQSGEVSSEWIVGENAKRGAVANPLNTIYGVKRLIGRKFADPEVQKIQALSSYKIVPAPNGDAWVEVDGKAMAPAEISAKVLRDLKEAVEKQIGEPITEAVITVPAYFNDDQRRATRDAGAIAGLDVKRIINEPTAAALAYGMDKKEGGKIAVFDLGGGTFDVSILEVMADKEMGTMVQVLSTNGDTFLGGENFDERITEFLVKEINKEHGTEIDLSTPAGRSQYSQQIARIREAAEKAKIELSLQEMTTVNLQFLMMDSEGAPVNFEMNFSRRQLESLVKDFVDRTLEPCKKALEDAGLKVSDLDEVILVGGQTRMPMVVNAVKNFFGKEPRRDVNPDEIVSLGASVQGAILQGKVENVILLDVIPLSIGIKTKGGVMTPLIERNTPIPTEFKDVFSTAEDGQRQVDIFVHQGERPMAADNKLLGHFALTGIAPAKAGDPQIEVALSIDADGVLKVEAKDLKTGRAQKITVKANGGLTEDEVERMLKDAEANAEKDRVQRESLTAMSNADAELKEAQQDTEEDYFKQAPDALKKQFADTMKELTEARATKDVAKVLEKTQALKEVRFAITEAFNGAAPANDDAQQAPEAEKPAAAAADQNKPKPPKNAM
ncbi:MAG TPA: molecular chaperone DnaK [Alphaproteobacteria bacterium]|nr:molecular chaperone DnaK [Rhodospirillaceae bacterium]HRJ65760.1 molecular chaperone DnaK [Alphaproteobacteria bacterium]